MVFLLLEERGERDRPLLRADDGVGEASRRITASGGAEEAKHARERR